VEDIPPGYFLAASAVAPELPLILPEFGYRADEVYSEAEQEAYLRRVFSELRGHPVRAAVLYSLDVQAYLGTATWFTEAFGGIGMIRLDGTPKRSYALLHRTRRQQPTATSDDPHLAPCAFLLLFSNLRNALQSAPMLSRQMQPCGASGGGANCLVIR